MKPLLVEIGGVEENSSFQQAVALCTSVCSVVQEVLCHRGHRGPHGNAGVPRVNCFRPLPDTRKGFCMTFVIVEPGNRVAGAEDEF